MSAQRNRDLSRQHSGQSRPSRSDISAPQSSSLSPQPKTPTSSMSSKSMPDQYLYPQQVYQPQHQHQHQHQPQTSYTQQQRVAHQQTMAGSHGHPIQHQNHKMMTNMSNVSAGLNGNYNSLPRNSNQQHSHYGTDSESAAVGSNSI